MTTKVLYIKKPSQGLLNLVRKLQADKDAKKEALIASKFNYFPNK
ncbi:hypothetical protein [Pedobacter nutrimenti]|jgi:hypothetical protein|nr:hypothetical protein [Pedobacter nutrimenti]